MDDQYNYFGASVFWLYNVAALVFSGIVISTILELRRRNGEGRIPGLTLFTGLASLSFVVLAFNMLHVLIQSFTEWLQRHPAALRGGYATAVWRWSITSTLFQDFGEAIVADNARYLWAQSELLATLSICLYMGTKGQRWRQSAFTVPS